MRPSRLQQQLKDVQGGEEWLSLPAGWRCGTAHCDANLFECNAYDELVLNGVEPTETPIGRRPGECDPSAMWDHGRAV